MELAYPPAYILVKMKRTKVVQLAGLEKNVLPLVPLERTFTITHGKGQKLSVSGSNSIIDIGAPPTGGLTPFNVYVALS
ncbi:hypothetical protein AZE42_12582 [Rhizopogon vesiculosus]|uniref:Uncharacterized protein n=1 Tax=Rhizopogon vesiculosus TaxID=180088 RepID=A0A1J8QLZ3_9AGAM|nr:hypothetical protein AZE42_12582 [Rhizopogon vesiculosus]